MLTRNRWYELATILFLLRKWMFHGAHNLHKSLGMPFCQRILNYVIQVIESCPDNSRLVCEAFGTVRTIYRFTGDLFREKSVHKAIATVLEKVSNGSNFEALFAVLQVILNDDSFELDSVALGKLVKGISRVCNRPIALLTTNSDSNSQHDATLVLQAALKFSVWPL